MASSAPSVLRPAGSRDIPELARLWAESFPGEKDAEERARDLREGMTYGTLEDCWVAEEEGRLAGALRTYRLEMHLQGRPWPTMGLAGVAVAPDFRRRGLGMRMCRQALRVARDRGDALSALYPFRVAFYRRLGYVLAGALHHYRVAAADLPLLEGWQRVRRAGPGGDRDAVRDCYARVAARSNGLVTRRDAMWDFLEEEEHGVYLAPGEEDGAAAVEGYVVVRPLGRPGPEGRLRVKEMVAGTPGARDALLGWLSAQRDAWGEVEIDALPGEELHRLLPHARWPRSRPRGLWFESARVLRGPMLRILDVDAFRLPDAPPLDVADPDLADPDVADPDVADPDVADPDLADPALASRGGGMDIRDATRSLLDGTLPGLLPPPEGWTPALGLTDFRLLDEF